MLNAALGDNLGFVNPALYAIGGGGFRDIVGAPGPADNGFNGVKGYPRGLDGMRAQGGAVLTVKPCSLLSRRFSPSPSRLRSTATITARMRLTRCARNQAAQW